MRNKIRFVIDLQALQSETSAKRGIGRYTHALAEALFRNAPMDQFILLLNGMVGHDNARLRREFNLKWPNVTVRLWRGIKPLRISDKDDQQLAAKAIYDAVLVDCDPDAVLVTSLFEGFSDDCVTSVGPFPTAVICYDLIPFIFHELYLTDSKVRGWYQSKIDALKRADHY